ncbi:MAG TPA: extracellular solute-binding protein [Galbitalea sp.]|nr:extracellular solute-binding protein [Galbitalea sp.]
MSKIHSRVAVSIAAIAVVVTMSACSSGSSTPSSSSTASTGKTEGTLTLYTERDPQEIAPVITDFEEKTGIQVQVFASTAAGVAAKLEAEEASGVHTADVIEESGDTNMLALETAGNLAKLPKSVTSLIPKQDPAFTRGNGYSFSVTTTLVGIAYNTNLVKGKNIPKEFTDLLSPYFKGKFSVPISTNSTSIQSFYQMTKLSYLGKKYITGLGNNGAVISAHSGDQVSSLITGDQVAAITNDNAVWPQIVNGAPIKFVYPSKGLAAVNAYEALVTGAPHPKAAAAFLQFLTTKKAQQDLATTGSTLTIPGTPLVPANRPTVDKLKFFTNPDTAALLAAQSTMVPFLTTALHE